MDQRPRRIRRMARLQRGRRAIGIEHFVQLVSIPHARDERAVIEHFYRWQNERNQWIGCG